jgi:hypothetical protein
MGTTPMILWRYNRVIHVRVLVARSSCVIQGSDAQVRTATSITRTPDISIPPKCGKTGRLRPVDSFCVSPLIEWDTPESFLRVAAFLRGRSLGDDELWMVTWRMRHHASQVDIAALTV